MKSLSFVTFVNHSQSIGFDYNDHHNLQFKVRSHFQMSMLNWGSFLNYIGENSSSKVKISTSYKFFLKFTNIPSLILLSFISAFDLVLDLGLNFRFPFFY